MQMKRLVEKLSLLLVITSILVAGISPSSVVLAKGLYAGAVPGSYHMDTMNATGVDDYSKAYLTFNNIKSYAVVVVPNLKLEELTLTPSNVVPPTSVQLNSFYGSTGEHKLFAMHVSAGRYTIALGNSDFNTAIDPDMNIYIAYDNPPALPAQDDPTLWQNHVDGQNVSNIYYEKLSYINHVGSYIPSGYFDIAKSAWLYIDIYGHDNYDYSAIDEEEKVMFDFAINATITATATSNPSGNISDRFEPNDEAGDAYYDNNPYFMPNVRLDDLNIRPNDKDVFRTALSDGRYSLSTVTTNSAVDIQMKVEIIHPAILEADGITPTRDTYNISQTGVLPALIFLNDDPYAQLEVTISGIDASRDYAMFGEYSLLFNLVTEVAGTEDYLEPDNSESNATYMAIGSQFDNLTIYSNSVSPDKDYFTLIVAKGSDFHCDATSASSMLNLQIIGHAEGEPDGDYGDTSGMRVSVNQNYIGPHPRIAINNAQGDTRFYFRVELENPETAEYIGNIKYTFSCTNGVGTPDTSATSTPSSSDATNTPTSSSGYSSNTAVPTATALPQSVSFKGRLVSEVQPTTAVADAEFFSVTFIAYSDANANSSYDPDEAISGLKIFVMDNTTKKIVKNLETASDGQKSLPLEGKTSNFSYLVPLLNLNKKFPNVSSSSMVNSMLDITINAPKFTYSSVIP